MVVTSPPYDNLRTYNGSLEWSFEIFQNIAKELSRIIKDGGVIVWNVADATIKGSETGTSFRQALYFKDQCGLNLHDTMIYEKSGTGASGSRKAYWQTFEYMFVLAKGEPKSINLINDKINTRAGSINTRGRIKANGELKDTKVRETPEFSIRTNIWRYAVGNNGDKNTTGHPAPFPISMSADHILSWSNPGELVLDPFGGSGTTAIAAHRTGRRSICMEKDVGYYLASCGRVWKEQQP